MFSILLSPKQTEILNFIIGYIETQGFPPSIRDIGKNCNIVSSGAVTVHINALIKKGYLSRIPNTPRGLRVLRTPQNPEQKVKVSIVGEIAAGKPIYAEQSFEDDFIELDQHKLPTGRELYALKVKGDSMTGEKIHNGDIVIIAYQNTANNGDIVVARINDEVTLKKFKRVDNYIALIPANPLYDSIPVIGNRDNLIIQGKLVTTVCTHN